MTFKIGDSVVHKEKPKSKVVFYLANKNELAVINAQAHNFRYATEDEIEIWNGSRQE